MKNPLILSLIAVICFSIWPVMAKYSKMPSIMISMLVLAGSFTVAIFWFYMNTTIGQEMPAKRSILLVCAGIINGVGIVVYSKLMDAESGYDMSKYITLISAGVPAVNVLSAVIFLGKEFGEGLTTRKAIGLTVIMLGIVVGMSIIQKK